MCGIFKCLGWALDFINSLWSLVMSCCIIGAISTLCLMGAVAGVSMGYNYAITEYQETKGQLDSNITLFIKRGVFDDEDSGNSNNDIMRRTMPPINSGREQYSSSGRRLDDHIIIGQDARKRFEGSLMKFEAKKGDLPYSTLAPYVEKEDEEQIKIINNLKSKSMEQLKAIQNLINRRQMQNITASTKNIPTRNIISQQYDQQPNSDDLANRRLMKYNEMQQFTEPLLPFRNLPTKGESLREYVPDPGIGDPIKWFLPKLPPNIQKDFTSQDSDPNLPITFPLPVTPRRGPLKPSQGRTRTTTVATTTENTVPKIDFRDIFHSDPYVREFDVPRTEETTPQIIDNYDLNIGGYPVKRKRNNQPVKRSLSNIVVLHDPKIYKTSKEMSNHTENIYNKVITVFEYVTKTIRAEALMNDTEQKSLHSGLKILLRPQ